MNEIQFYTSYCLLGDHKFAVNPYNIKVNAETQSMAEIMLDFLHRSTIQNIWEPETTKTIKGVVKEGMTVIDIGASMGYFTMILSNLVGNEGKVLAFEPQHPHLKYLLMNLSINKCRSNVYVYKTAMWDKKEKISKVINQEVEADSLDNFLREQKIQKVDFIKIDVDGAEPWVLKGMIETIENNPQLKMIIECHKASIDLVNGSWEDYNNILNKYFNLKVIENEYEGMWNYLCIKI